MGSRSLVVTLWVLLVLGAFLLPELAAQDERKKSVSGRVTRTGSGEPDPSARVFLDTGQESTTDAEGRFSFGAVTPGRHRVAAVGRGCFFAIGEVTVEVDTPALIEFDLISPHRAAGLSTTMLWEDLPGVTGSPWKIISDEDIRRAGAADILQVLQNALPQVVGTGGGVSGRGRVRSMRGNNSVVGPNLPVVIIDGIRVMEQPELVLGNMDPGSVSRIEIFRGPAGAWVHGSGSAGGVIRVFSKRFEITIDPTTPAELCGNPLLLGGN